MEGTPKFGAHRLVHLDLKRAPLKLDYLAKVNIFIFPTYLLVCYFI